MNAMHLDSGSTVGVIGGGPAGSFFSYFLLKFAQLMDIELAVDIFEPRDFTKVGPGGCNMCGGIVSESLVQALAAEGINLPSSVVQRGIDSYVLHTNDSSVRIDTPLHEKRIAAIHRGGGPRDTEALRWGGLDGYLLGLAQEMGARLVPVRVNEVGWDEGRPQIRDGNSPSTYDLLVGATGVNSAGWDLFESLGFTCERPVTSKAYITELHFPNTAATEDFGNSMHVFMLNIPRLDCAAIIPKGDFLTVCLLGKDIDRELIESFFAAPPVARCFPPDQAPAPGACHCSPKINLHAAARGYMDRIVLVGDCGVTRLYKDGIGAAYRTGKSAARTAIFSGVSAADFDKHFKPAYRAIARDNGYGSFMFGVVHWIKALKPLVGGVLRMTAAEQERPGAARRMSMILWDMFTGSAPYRDIFFRTVDPRFLAGFAGHSMAAATIHRREGDPT